MQRLDGACPELGHRCRILRQSRRIAVEAKPDRIASFDQMAGSDEAIAAIVAGAAKHRDAARIRKAQGDLVGHRAACILHEHAARHPALNGEAIGLAHFLGGQ